MQPALANHNCRGISHNLRKHSAETTVLELAFSGRTARSAQTLQPRTADEAQSSQFSQWCHEYLIFFCLDLDISEKQASESDSNSKARTGKRQGSFWRKIEFLVLVADSQLPRQKDTITFIFSVSFFKLACACDPKVPKPALFQKIG